MDLTVFGADNAVNSSSQPSGFSSRNRARFHSTAFKLQKTFTCLEEINIAMTADAGTLQRMPKLIPEGVGREIAQEIASKSPMAIWGTKRTMNYSRYHSVADGLDYIATWNAAMFDTDDMTEGL
jgi:enoyl-CoA hydratase